MVSPSSTVNGYYLGGAVKSMLMAHDTRMLRSRLRPGSPATMDGTQYQYSQFGYAVSWVQPWTVVGIDDSVATSAGPGTETIVIGMRDSGLAEVRIVGADRRNVLDPAETARFWTTPRYLTEFMDRETVVVLSEHSGASAAVVLVSPGRVTGQPVVTVKESYELRHNVSVRATFTADFAIFHDMYRSLQQSLELDRRAPVSHFSPDVLRAVLP